MSGCCVPEMAAFMCDNPRTEGCWRPKRSTTLTGKLHLGKDSLPTHKLYYPGPQPHPDEHQRLELSPSMTKQLVLLAELVGWSPYWYIMLDMASRRDDGQGAYYSSSRGWSWQLGRT